MEYTKNYENFTYKSYSNLLQGLCSGKQIATNLEI